MCAINPTHKKRFILDVFTFAPQTTRQEFEQLVMEKTLIVEQLLNGDMRLRWHVKEAESTEDNKP